jgi:nicotinate-nucleotide pyrophosphorylase (carboxylating)
MFGAELPIVMVEPVVRAALLEDLGVGGDITTTAVASTDARAKTAFVARQPGTVAGIGVASLAFRLLDHSVEIDVVRADASKVVRGDVIAIVRGPAQAILTAERAALNLLCHLSGVATATALMVEAVRGHPARISCTRKTLPGLRALQKYAVRVGGGTNHRFGLSDAVLIKDNHIAVAGDIGVAVRRVRACVGHVVKIEVEVDSLAQLEQALEAGVDAVLLDNMELEDLCRAVEMVGGRALTEASGRITPSTAREVAATGVDLISAGWVTHSATALDIGLDWDGLEAG